ncbi:MAG: M20/M25/M40 family metallo-hydrolase [Erythrobacter sp.]
MGARIWAVLGLAALLGACATPLARVPRAERAAISARMMSDITVLASDEFGGRKPGTPGEERTLEYLTKRFADVGLVSGTNDPASPWRAPVGLVSTRLEQSTIALLQDDMIVELGNDQAIAITRSRQSLLEDADMVFVGNGGDTVPEAAIAGSVAVMLTDESLNPARRTALERKGAAAVIVVPRSDESYARIRQRLAGEALSLADKEDGSLGVAISNAAMEETLGVERWRGLKASAQSDDFTPVRLKWSISIAASANRREFVSHNLVGMLPGTRPEAGAVLLLAHWDHLGECGPDGVADRLCNGAVDNASGVALMLELARRLSAKGPHERDIYVLATSAEEAGLLGARAFVANPPVPLDSIVAAFNFDTSAVAPAGSSVGFVGEGRTALDRVIFEVMEAARRDLGNRNFAETFVKRQDGWALLEAGVPTVFLSTSFGSQITFGPYLEAHYHGPSDEIDVIELGGAIDDLLLHEELVMRFADTAAYPGR